MIALTLADIAAITGGTLDRAADPAAVVAGPVVIDSRRAGRGALFAALPGEHADGHDFAPAAVEASGPHIAVLAIPGRRQRVPWRSWSPT